MNRNSWLSFPSGRRGRVLEYERVDRGEDGPERVGLRFNLAKLSYQVEGYQVCWDEPESIANWNQFQFYHWGEGTLRDLFRACRQYPDVYQELADNLRTAFSTGGAENWEKAADSVLFALTQTGMDWQSHMVTPVDRRLYEL